MVYTKISVFQGLSLLWKEWQVPSGQHVRVCCFKVDEVFADVWLSGPVFSYTLRYIEGLVLVEMAISINPKPTIYRNVYENTGPGI